MTTWPDGRVPGNSDADQRQGWAQQGPAQDRVQMPPAPGRQPFGLAEQRFGAGQQAWAQQPSGLALPPSGLAQQPPGWGQPAYAAAARPGNSMAVAGLILGITSIVFSWWGLLTLAQVVLAIVFGYIGLSRANQGMGGRGPAIAGMICGCVGGAIYFVIGLVSLGIGFLI